MKCLRNFVTSTVECLPILCVLIKLNGQELGMSGRLKLDPFMKVRFFRVGRGRGAILPLKRVPPQIFLPPLPEL